ncbi:uncharacterized protein LOC123682275 isoform X2 [Harmonia axyridis]|nr:uncharacterized protein LOC123682275 isoform X2 [Harmonia axyridis]
MLLRSGNEVVDKDVKKPKKKKAKKTKKDNVKLTRGGKKRMKLLMEGGMAQEEAKKLALQMFGPKLTMAPPAKKIRLEDSTPKGKEPMQTTQEVSKASQFSGASKAPIPNRPIYSQKITGIKVGILDKNYPEVLLRINQLKAIEAAILESIFALEREATVRPKFQHLHNRPGWLGLTCLDIATLEWLKSILPKLKPWEGAELRIVEEAELPYPQILTGYLPNSQDLSNEQIFFLMEIQNEDLKTSGWRILRREPSNTMLEVVISADSKSVEKLKALNCRINYKFGQISLHLKGHKISVSSTGSEKPNAGEEKKVVELSDTKEPGRGEVPLGCGKGESGGVNAAVFSEQPGGRPSP